MTTMLRNPKDIVPLLTQQYKHNLSSYMRNEVSSAKLKVTIILFLAAMGA